MGRAGALACAREGARVVVSDVAIERGEETVRIIGDAGGEAVVHPEVYQQIADPHPIERLSKPEKIAEAAVWQCSDASSLVTGPDDRP